MGTTSDADIATEVSRRDTRISAADATLQAELDRLQDDVNFANGELVAAQAAQDAQEIIKDAAIADRVLKESRFYQTLEEGNNRKAAALAKRVTCVANANAAYADETATADAAAAECNNDKNECEHSKITALNDGSTQTARRLLVTRKPQHAQPRTPPVPLTNHALDQPHC